MRHPAEDEVPSTGAEDAVEASRRGYEDMRITYDVLRWMMIGLPAILFVVTGFNAVCTGSFENSISAYYGGPVRDVFVGVIIATAACMVAYRGWFALEDFALNAAGFFAVFVALVPAGLSAIMDDLRETELALATLKTSSSLAGELPAVLDNDELPFTAAEYGSSLRVALTCVLVLCAALVWSELKQSRRTLDLFKRGGWGRWTIICTAVLALSFIILTYGQLFLGPADQVSLPGLSVGALRVDVHTIAAVLMIASLVVVVACHGWPQLAVRGDPKRALLPADHDFRRTYKIIFFLMLVGVPCLAVLGMVFFSKNVVLILEWYEIILFCWFWFLETRRVSRWRRMVGTATS